MPSDDIVGRPRRDPPAADLSYSILYSLCRLNRGLFCTSYYYGFHLRPVTLASTEIKFMNAHSSIQLKWEDARWRESGSRQAPLFVTVPSLPDRSLTVDQDTKTLIELDEREYAITT